MSQIPPSVLIARILTALRTLELHLEAGNGPLALRELAEARELVQELNKALRGQR